MTTEQNQQQNVELEQVADATFTENVAAEPQVRQVLHVQVSGDSTVQHMKDIAEVYRAALDSNRSEAVVTNPDVRSQMIWTAAQGPVDALYVQQVLTLEDLTRVAVLAEASLHAERIVGEDQWHLMSEEDRVKSQNRVLLVLKGQWPSDDFDHDLYDISAVFASVVLSLRSKLMIPTEDPTVQVWTGSPNLGDAAAWASLKFSQLRESMIFKSDLNPGYWVSSSAAYAKYDARNVVYAIDAALAEVQGTRALDEKDLSKGFTLNWKLSEDQKSPLEEADHKAITAVDEVAATVVFDDLVQNPVVSFDEEQISSVPDGDFKLDSAPTTEDH